MIQFSEFIEKNSDGNCWKIFESISVKLFIEIFLSMENWRNFAENSFQLNSSTFFPFFGLQIFRKVSSTISANFSKEKKSTENASKSWRNHWKISVGIFFNKFWKCFYSGKRIVFKFVLFYMKRLKIIPMETPKKFL